MTQESRDKIVLLVGIEGIYDLLLLDESFPDYAAWFLNAVFGSDKSKWIDYSFRDSSLVDMDALKRVHHVILYSLKDELIDEKQGKFFVDFIKSKGCFSPANLMCILCVGGSVSYNDQVLTSSHDGVLLQSELFKHLADIIV